MRSIFALVLIGAVAYASIQDDDNEDFDDIDEYDDNEDFDDIGEYDDNEDFDDIDEYDIDENFLSDDFEYDELDFNVGLSNT